MKKERIPKARLVWSWQAPKPMSWSEMLGAIGIVLLVLGVGGFLAVKAPPVFAMISILMAMEACSRR